MGWGAGLLAPGLERWHLPLVGNHTHRISATIGLWPAPPELFLAQDSVLDEGREGTSHLLIWFSHTELAAQ